MDDKGDADTKSGEVADADVAGVGNVIPGRGGVWASTLKAVCGKPAELVGREAGSGLGGANGTREATVDGGNEGGVATGCGMMWRASSCGSIFNALMTRSPAMEEAQRLRERSEVSEMICESRTDKSARAEEKCKFV